MSIFAGIGHNKPPSNKPRKGGLYHCHTCKRDIHSLGIMRHRAMHREKLQDCKITFSGGDTYLFSFSRRPTPGGIDE